MKKFCQYILQLVLSPGKAWEDIAGDEADARPLERNGMVPLMIVAALSALLQSVYHSGVSVFDALVRGAGIFVSLYAGFNIACQLFAKYVGRFTYEQPDLDCTRMVAMLGLSMMSLTALLCNLMPVQLGLPYLLSLYSVIVIWRSAGYLGVNRDLLLGYLAFVVASIAMPPMLIQALIDYVVKS